MKKVLVVASFFMTLISASMIGYKIVSANEKVDEIKDVIVEQSEKEAYLTPYGYTIENPNIILNPYGDSPLTAMILFETEEEEPVTIVIEGKDQNSTYTNTFKSTTKHYIPVYGLYPNTENKIEIKCGNITKTITITTDPLPNDLIPKSIENNSNNLYFITSDTYPYALDNNNEVRWYLTKNYTKKISRLQNGHFLLSTDTLISNQKYSGLVEIDLLGKIYKQYDLNNGYYGSYTETDNSLLILSDSLLEIDKQTGTILNTFSLKEKYDEVIYFLETNTVTLLNDTKKQDINLKTKDETSEYNNQSLNNEQELLSPLYNTEENYKLTQGIKFTTNEKTEESNQTIFLINYKKIDNNYKKHNITITKNSDTLEINGNFTKEEAIYLILDKFLDKKVYDITQNQTIINKEGLSGKYSIYIKINHTIYKTNTYINF